MAMDRLKIKWRNGCDVSLVLSELLKNRSKTDDGRTSFSGGEVNTYLPVLETALVVPTQIPPEIAAQALRQTIFSKTPTDKINSRWLIDEVNRRVNKKLQSIEKEFFVVTTLSYSGLFPLKRILIDNCWISFDIKGAKFMRPGESGRSDLTEELRRLAVAVPKMSHALVSVKVQARSETEAFRKGMNALDLVRAMVNILLNPGGSYFQAGRLRPVNFLTLGPAHTVHYPNGERWSQFWYEPDFSEPITMKKIPDSIDTKYLRFWRVALSRPGLSEAIRHGLLHYVRALDKRDPMEAFRDLWITLEYLTRTQPNQSLDVTVRRLSSLYKNKRLFFELANHLRIHRNSLIHFSGIESPESAKAQELTNVANMFAKDLLWFCASSSSLFHDHKELADFLDLRETFVNIGSKKRLIAMAERLYRFDSV